MDFHRMYAPVPAGTCGGPEDASFELDIGGSYRADPEESKVQLRH